MLANHVLLTFSLPSVMPKGSSDIRVFWPWFQNKLLGRRCKREIFAFVDGCKVCDCFSFLLSKICTSSSYGISSKLITFAFVTFIHESFSLFLYFFSKSIIIMQLFFFPAVLLCVFQPSFAV